MDPQGPSQPNLNTAYKVPGNPTDKEPSEQNQADFKAAQDSSSEIVDRRSSHDVPSTHDADARPSALNAGETGPLTEKSIPGSDSQNYTQEGDPNLEGEQMRAPGEGDVARIVQQGQQGGKSEPSFTEDLDKKKKEHMQALEERGESLEQREKEDWTGKKDQVDLGNALGGRGTGVVLTGDTSNLGGGRESLGDA